MKRVIFVILSLAMVLTLSACGRRTCNHDFYASDYEPATGTSNGFTKYTCKQCGKSYKEVIPQKGGGADAPIFEEEPADADSSELLGVVSGHWDGTVSLGDANVGIYALDDTIKGCKSMTIYANFDMKAGTHCYDWTIYARSNGRWEEIGTFNLPNGTGEGTQTINMDGSMYIDAITLAPTVPGSYSWSWGLAIYDVEASYN